METISPSLSGNHGYQTNSQVLGSGKGMLFHHCRQRVLTYQKSPPYFIPPIEPVRTVKEEGNKDRPFFLVYALCVDLVKLRTHNVLV